MSGKVYLIGAGPGDPELLTLKAARLLARANVVLYDALVSREVLALVSPSAEIIDVGKRAGRKLLTQDEINAVLATYAKARETVVRLKGGDPTIFGRAGEEIDFLRKAGIDYEIVPGITAALGAAAAAGISLTDRRFASQVLFSTFSRVPDGAAADHLAVTQEKDWGSVTSTTTLVLYMPGADYAEVSERLRLAGLPADLPCVIVSNAARSKQQVRWSQLARLGSEEKLPAPALLIVGRVATRDVQELSASFWDGDAQNVNPQHVSVI
jgi:uroporphyrin-III C-methyltransferase